MKVISISYNITPTYKPVTCEADYAMVQRGLYNLRDVLIRPWSDLDIQHRGNIVVFTEEWKVTVTFLYKKKKYKFKYVFSPGFICDKGSIPKIARSYVDNDCPEFLFGFFVHDANYACHFPGVDRDMSDQLLRYMGRYGAENKGDTIKPKAGAIKAFAVYRAVWIAGAGAWEKERQTLAIERQFVSMYPVITNV